MLVIFYYLLLMFRVGRCTDDPIFETKIVAVGDYVKLTCTRKGTGSMFWIRLVSGNFPEVVGKTFSFEGVERHIKTKEEPGTFVLHITEAKLSDTAVYVCMKIHQQNFTFLNGTDLKVEESDITTVPPSDPVRPGDSVTLQCSVLSDSENKTCPGELSVCCFRDGSHQSHSSFNYTQGNSVEDYYRLLDYIKKCFYSKNIFKNMISSDTGTYYFAVATCDEIFSGNGTKLGIEAVDMWDSQRSTMLFLLGAALAISLIVIAYLISSLKACDSCNGKGTLLILYCS
ncbi:uncharacterized protein LOC119888428 [Micropterus salmoides]|uniref:uncharacterized protein LOC119888428 n=1 Tax=Micropterus salmoides TaxID=27706 RepID=UPI0018ED8379|nr:uncharacterized protein LOC119888428 [Micropterus salmoides]